MELWSTPGEVVEAALTTESSTMDELKCFCDICVRAFIHCTVRNTFDVCTIGIEHVQLELHALSFVLLEPLLIHR